MNGRQRYLETLLFGKPDRIPLQPGYGRRSTRRAWHAQGLPAEIDDSEEINTFAYQHAGGQEELPRSGEAFGVSERMIPEFESKIIERRERTLIVQDWKGNICEISDEFGPEYLRYPLDFVTRSWIRCPVETWEDWEGMKERYDPHEPARYSEDLGTAAKRLKDRDWVLTLIFAGPFWQMREWLGFEQLCVTFYDDPALIRDMVAFWEAFILELLDKTLGQIVPDVFYISEDMAYKRFAMISPEMTRNFLLPTYRRWGERVRSAGVPIYDVDSDGFVGQLIPIWIEAGVNVCDPIEVAALNDIVEYRQQFGRRMAYRSGVDKRAIAKGGHAIEGEMERLKPVMESGGYIPGCDHGVPGDVSWSNYVNYVRLLAQATGWL
jgi:uroporphyrinogen decarboxylase